MLSISVIILLWILAAFITNICSCILIHNVPDITEYQLYNARKFNAIIHGRLLRANPQLYNNTGQAQQGPQGQRVKTTTKKSTKKAKIKVEDKVELPKLKLPSDSEFYEQQRQT